MSVVLVRCAREPRAHTGLDARAVPHHRGKLTRPRYTNADGRLISFFDFLHATPTVAVAGPAAQAAPTPELLSPAEAALALGVTEADVTAVLESGELKGRKIGSTWRIPRAAIASYLS